MSVGFLEWPIALCEKNFIDIASRIFPKPCPTFGSLYRKLYFAARLLLRDSFYPEAGPTIQSVIGDGLLRGPRQSLFEERPAEQKHLTLAATEASEGKWRIFTSYDKSTHEDAICYMWAQQDGALSDVKVWQRYSRPGSRRVVS